jgi:hypothetical protein
VPVSPVRVGWLTGASLAAGEAALVFFVPWLHPRTTDVLALAVGGILISGLASGLTALLMHSGAEESRAWPRVVRSVTIGIYVGVATLVFLYALVWVLLLVLLAHSNIGGF